MGMWNLSLVTGIIYLFYLLIGGTIFTCLDLLGTEHTVSSNSTYNFTDMENILLKNFPQQVINSSIKDWKTSMTKHYFSNETIEPYELDWTYSKSFFFAFHLCSTVGYGDVYPSTSYGQIFVIFFTLIGMPFHVLFFTMLGESFAQSYQETMLKVTEEKDSFIRKILGKTAFLFPWIIVFYVLPSIAFMYTEDWNFIEGIYYSFITQTTIGLGDYVAGSTGENRVTYTLYRLAIFVWMLYGLAFTQVIMEFLTHLFQLHMLFSFKCSCRKCVCKFERQYIDIEKMDVHFRLVRAEAVKGEYSMWSVREGTRQAVGFRTNHMLNLAALCERIQGELIELLELYEKSSTEILKAKKPKDAHKLIPKEKLKKNWKDAFPVKASRDSSFTDII